MALWLDISTNSQKFAEKAKTHRILVNPESHFRLDGQPGTHLRLGFSGQTPNENKRGLEALFKLL